MDPKDISFETLTRQEEELTFDRFSREDALQIGLAILDKARQKGLSVATEITVNGLVVFRYFSEGAVSDSELWLDRKRNTVDLMSMSSLRFKYWLETTGQTIEDRHLPPGEFAAFGGGFPIRLKQTGCIGSICVSGPPNHYDDHQLIVDVLTAFLNR